MPPDVIKAQCARYRQHGKPWHRPELQNWDDYDIVRRYGAEYQGVVNYYLLAQDVYRLNTLWLQTSHPCSRPGAKHHSTVSKMAAKHKAKVKTKELAADLLRGQETPAGQGGPDSTIRRDHPAARPARGNPRTPARPGRLPPQGADIPAPHTGMRALRDRDHGGSPPGHQPQGTRAAGTGPARVGRPHGENAA